MWVEPSAAFDGTLRTADGVRAASSVSKQLCFRSTVMLLNVGIGEDTWTTSPLEVVASGQLVNARVIGSSLWTPLQLLSTGCVSGTWSVGTWEFQAVSKGKMRDNGQTLEVLSAIHNNGLHAVGFTAEVTAGTTAQKITYNAAASPIVNAYHIAHKSLTARASALTDATLGSKITVYGYDPDTGADVNGAYVAIASSYLADKWVIAHEMGHLVEIRETYKPATFGISYDLTDVKCASVDPFLHHLYSREPSSAAHMEGFASFWAASAFNYLEQSDCSMGVGSSTFDCAMGSGSKGPAYMEKNCADSTPFTGHGNELDWQRTFWGMVAGGSNRATIKQVLELIKRGQGWNANNHYQRISAAANLSATPDHVESRWESGSDLHGIDH